MGARARLIMKLYHFILVNALLVREFGNEYREAEYERTGIFCHKDTCRTEQVPLTQHRQRDLGEWIGGDPCGYRANQCATYVFERLGNPRIPKRIG